MKPNTRTKLYPYCYYSYYYYVMMIIVVVITIVAIVVIIMSITGLLVNPGSSE